MQSYFGALLPFAVFVAACSSETTGSSTTGPSDTAPQGAVNVEIYATPAQDCPIGNIHVDIGNSRLTPPELAVDAYQGADIACSVVSSAMGFTAMGSLKQGSLAFSFDGVTSSGASAVGHVTVADPATGDVYESAVASPCVFQFAPGSGQGLEAGKAWMQFDCSSLAHAKDATKACSARYGYVFVDRCAKK